MKFTTFIANKFLRCPHVKVAKGYLVDFSEFHNPKCNQDDPSSNEHLAWMLSEIAKNIMSRTKANRWLGYVQSKMEDRGLISVEIERERTRCIFNGL